MEPLPDLGSLDDEALKDLIDRYVEEENQVSYRRRILHGYIDILRSELLSRKTEKYSGEGSALEGIDIERLSRILAGKGLPADGSEAGE